MCEFGFHGDAASRGELADASKRVDCIMVYIYCTNTLSGPFASATRHIQIAMETAEGEKNEK